jgi:hypothetical protein
MWLMPVAIIANAALKTTVTFILLLSPFGKVMMLWPANNLGSSEFVIANGGVERYFPQLARSCQDVLRLHTLTGNSMLDANDYFTVDAAMVGSS